MLYHCIESEVNTDSVSKQRSDSCSSTKLSKSPVPSTLSTLPNTNGLLDIQPEKKGIRRVLDCNH